MIGRVLPRGSRVAGLIWYLYGPGKACEHVNPRIVAGWRHPAELEPPLRPAGPPDAAPLDDLLAEALAALAGPAAGRAAAAAPAGPAPAPAPRAGGRRDFRMLNDLLMQPVTALGRRAPAQFVWHCVVRAADGDPELGDGAWMRIAGEIMHRTGLSRYGEEDEGVRWVAVHHGDNHIHVVATLARQDGGRASLDNDFYRIGEALRDLEAEYGLTVVARADRTADRRPGRAETEKAARAGQAEPSRVTLRRHVAAAAAGARSEPEFFAALARRGVQVRLRYSEHDPGQVTGYAVTIDEARTAAGDPVWFGGGKLAPDLTLPKLRRRWPDPGGPARRPPAGPAGGPGRPRLHGRGMTDSPARAALRREVAAAAAGARSEPAFFAGLEAAGLLVRLRPGPGRPGEAAGYAVSLPGMIHHRDGQQVWYGGQTLDGQLGLGAMRRRWRAGRPGAPAAAADFTGAETRDIFGYAAAAAGQAARALRAGPGPAEAADIAWAAADVLHAAADATGSGELRRAADGFARAARAPWGRIPPPSQAGAGLRTAAYLLTRPVPDRTRRLLTRLALAAALAGLAGAVAELREAQQRLAQAAAARRAAAGLSAAAAGTPPAAPGPARPAAADVPWPAARPAAARPGTRPRRPPRPPRPGPPTGPGRSP